MSKLDCRTNHTATIKSSWVWLVVLLALGGLHCNYSNATEPSDALINDVPAGFSPLFDGLTLNGWHDQPERKQKSDLNSQGPRSLDEKADSKFSVTNSPGWKVQEGTIVNLGQSSYLTSDMLLEDFEFCVQYKPVTSASASIHLRGVTHLKIADSTIEVLMDTGIDQHVDSSQLNAIAANQVALAVISHEPIGEWNQLRIRLVGERCWVWLNGTLTVNDARMMNPLDPRKPLCKQGPVQIQSHSGEIQWKNFFVKKFLAEESNSILHKADVVDAEYLFNGQKLEGWSGSTDSYEMVLRCKDGMGGTLLSQKDYSDFQLFVEFRLPSAGNNGLVIRYPREEPGADGAYESMCELQILDDEHPSYQGLDPRQAHGSAYGMIPAARGFLRPVGQWNYEKVTVQGSKISVELNGFKILDGDIADVKEFLADRVHPGKDRTSGAVGLAGHSDPVEFRVIAIKQLAKK